MNRKPIFDAVRKLLGRRFRPAEVAALDAAIDEAVGARRAEDGGGAQEMGAARKIGPKGVELIQRFEGYEETTYRDPGTGDKPYTGGWGTTRDESGQPLPLGVTWPQARWEALLKRDLEKYAAEVSAALGDAPTTQAQFDALVSFHYNTGAIGRATLTKMHKAKDYAGAAKEFARWTRAGGRVLNGLVRRRAAEAALYRSTT